MVYLWVQNEAAVKSRETTRASAAEMPPFPFMCLVWNSCLTSVHTPFSVIICADRHSQLLEPLWSWPSE